MSSLNYEKITKIQKFRPFSNLPHFPIKMTFIGHWSELVGCCETRSTTYKDKWLKCLTTETRFLFSVMLVLAVPECLSLCAHTSKRTCQLQIELLLSTSQSASLSAMIWQWSWTKVDDALLRRMLPYLTWSIIFASFRLHRYRHHFIFSLLKLTLISAIPSCVSKLVR